MTNDEKMNEIFDETNEFFKKKVREAYGLDERVKIADICDGYIDDAYDALTDCYFEEDDERCKTCPGFKICQKMDELDVDEWNELEYEEPNNITDNNVNTTFISNNGISW